jgi:hypothetical protein
VILPFFNRLTLWRYDMGKVSFAVVCGCLLVLVGGIVGCEEPPAPPPRVVTPLTPQEKFDLIVASLKDAMESSTNRGMVIFDRESGSRGTVSYKVNGRFVEPPSIDTPPRGVVEVLLQSKYVPGTRPEREEDEQRENREKRESEGSGEIELLEGIDPELLADLPRPRAGNKPPAMPQRIEALEDKSEYVLEYKRDRWQLVTEIDAERESALQLAFDLALKKQ